MAKGQTLEEFNQELSQSNVPPELLENDPGNKLHVLGDADFAIFKSRGIKPEELVDPMEREQYRKYLEDHPS